MIQNRLLRGALSAAIALPASGWIASASAQCSNATLKGDYAFTIEGQTLGIKGPPNQMLPSPIPVNGVALTSFDGKGGLTQVDYVMKGGLKRPGNAAANGFDSGETGAYQVFSNCTGTFEVDFASENYLTVQFVLAGINWSGPAREIHTVVSEQHVPNMTPVGDDLTCAATTGCDLLVQIRSDGHALETK
jgi:hypothetical protein